MQKTVSKNIIFKIDPQKSELLDPLSLYAKLDPRGETGSAVSVWDALRTNQNARVKGPWRDAGCWNFSAQG